MLNRLKSMWRTRSQREKIYSDAEFWNKKAQTYKGTAVSMFLNRTLNEYYQRDQFSFFDKCLGEIGGRQILDAGCGTGRLSRHLAEKGACVTAFDFAEKAIKIAETESAGLAIKYSVGSVFEIDNKNSFDDVVTIGCLSMACKNCDEFRQVIERIHTTLRPGGRLVLIDPFHKGFLHRVLRLSKAEVITILKSSGFDILATRELHFWPTRLLLTLSENTPVWITKFLYHTSENFLRLMPTSLRLGDYKGIAAVRRA